MQQAGRRITSLAFALIAVAAIGVNDTKGG